MSRGIERSPGSSGFTLGAFEASAAGTWDQLVGKSPNGTFMHTRRFLDYHRDRFVDRSLCILDGEDRLVGVFPAAVDPGDETRVVSHPGLSYGGLVHDGSLRGEAMLAALAAVAEHYRGLGFRALRYRAVPPIYHRVPSQDDLYALSRLGANRYRCDLSATVDLDHRGRVAHGRRTALARARRNGLVIDDDWRSVAGFWDVLEANLKRHDATPTHSLAEMRILQVSFPESVSLISASKDHGVVAGILLFSAPPVCHAQYIASNDEGRALGGTDAVIDAAIRGAVAAGFRYFDFGISTEDQGRHLNASLQAFKASFGAGAVVFEHYELGL